MRMMYVLLTALLLLVPLAQVAAQQAGETPAAGEQSLDTIEHFRLATSSADYPVTPGDVYRLEYRQGDAVIANQLMVEGDYSISLGVFGKVNGAGRTFIQLKQTVEERLLAGYPRSMPSLTIASIGIFRVHVRGETPRSQYVTAWGLMRVSDVIGDLGGPYASLRNVELISRSGASRRYDVFRATRFGDSANDPYVKPGDTVVLYRSERRVRVEGEVRQPGTYDLLAGEQLRELVESYGAGLTSDADASRVRIERVSGERPRVEYVSLSEGFQRPTPLENGDILTIPAKSANLLTVFFEGAIVSPLVDATPAGGATAGGAREETGTPELAQYNRVLYSFKEGESLSDALREVRASIAPLADLSQAFLVREGRADPIGVDLRLLISSPVSASDIPLQSNDRIVIPWLRFFVSISGAVANPGTYSFAPNRTYQHYIDLAGGSAQDPPEEVVITDRNGHERKLGDFIQAEDRIFVIPATVLVQGAVFAPGSFAFRAGLPVSYYLNLAGGIDPERHPGTRVVIRDSEGARRKVKDPLKPGDQIYVPACAPIYNLNRYSNLIAAIATVVTAGLAVYAALGP